MTRIYLSPPHVSGRESELLAEALESNWIAPLGPQVDAFEAEFGAVVDVPHAVALSSGTAGLHLAMRLLGVGPGDEVICPTLSFVATSNAALYCGAQPVFVDSDAASWNLDPSLLADELAACRRRGKLPKAVVSVDLYGQSADHDAIAAACAPHDIPIVEDAAEALGARYRGKPVGGFGRLGVFSFNGNKIVTTSGGGMLVAHEAELVERARFFATQAREPAAHYEHRELGYNYRLSNLLAAVGRAQLATLDERVEARRRNFATYLDILGGLPGIEFMPEPAWSRSTRWLTCLTVDRERFGAGPEEIRQTLEGDDIEARPVWKPMHLQPLYRHCRVRHRGVAEGLFARGLCLPSGSDLSREDLERVAEIVASCRR